jgi:uncharacterized protein YggE
MKEPAMNRKLRVLLLIAILPAFRAISQEADNYSLRSQTKDLLSFSCDGYGKKFYVADMVDLVFAVSFENADAQAARRSIEGVVSKVNAFLKEEGYGEEIVSLLSSEIKKEKRHVDQYKYQFFYTAKSTYALRTEKVANLEQLLTTLVGLGIDEIVSVSMISTKMTDLEDEARRLAVADAKRKAALTADELDWELGKVLSVQFHGETSYSYRPSDYGWGNRSGHRAPSAMAQSPLASHVGSRVALTFEYVVKK